MSKQLLIECPINNLSMGQVSINILKELHKKEDLDVIIYPITNGQFNFDESVKAYKLTDDFKGWLQNSLGKFNSLFNRNIPHLKVWHFSGSHAWVGDKRFLITFHETDQAMPFELQIIKNTTKTFTVGQYSLGVFKQYIPAEDQDKLDYFNLGFDSDEFFSVESKINDQDAVIWFLGGKAEVRKNTYSLINLWLQKYGVSTEMPNQKIENYLYCAISNQFYEVNPQVKQQTDGFLAQALMGKNWQNVTFYPFLQTNAEYNSLLNACDIDLTGLSSGESWNLPAFNMTCLGKHSIVMDAHGHKNWANQSNAILVKPVAKRPCYDGFFFNQGHFVSQGNFFDSDPQEVADKMDVARKVAKEKNEPGIETGKTMTYGKSVDQLLGKIL